MRNTLRDWAVLYDSDKNGLLPIVEDLEKASGLLQSMRMSPANNGFFHRYMLAEDLAYGGFRSLNGSIVPNSPTQEILTEDLSELAAIHELDSSYVESFNKPIEKVFGAYSSQFTTGMGQKLSRQYLYGLEGDGDADGFQGLRQLSIDNGLTQSMGGAEGSSATMFVIRWQPGVMEGLFNEGMMANGSIVDMEIINGGKTYTKTTNTTTGAVKPIKAAMYKTSLGLLRAGAYNVATITNIQDATDKKVSVEAIEKAIEQVKGYTNAGETVIVLNSRCMRLIKELKDTKITTYDDSDKYSARLKSWDGVIPFFIDDNITNTEDYS